MDPRHISDRISSLSIAPNLGQVSPSKHSSRPHHQAQFMVGVDLGGTSTRVALLENGRFLTRLTRPTPATDGPSAVIACIVSLIHQALDEVRGNVADLCGIALGAPGLVNARTGVVFAAPNLSGWHDVPLRAELEKHFALPIFIHNDANLATLAEHRYGAGSNVNNLIYLTVSTGIGAGIIIDGKLYGGASGTAGQIGHMYIEMCPDAPRDGIGHSGCLEAFASGTAIAREAKRLINSGNGQPIWVAHQELIAQNHAFSEEASLFAKQKNAAHAGNVTARAVIKAAMQGDSNAASIIRVAGQALGIACVNLIHCFNPEMIILGGGVSKAKALLLDPIREMINLRAFEAPARDVQIVLGELGDDAGLLGAAACLKDEIYS